MSQAHVHTDKLPELLSHGGALVLCVPTRTQERTALLTLLLERAVVAQQRRTRQEQAMLRALLNASPAPCSYATLYAAGMGMREEDAQVFIEGLQKGEALNMALLLGREVLWQCELKLEPFNLDIRPGDGAGDGRFRFWQWPAE